MVALLLRLDVGGVTIFIDISVQSQSQEKYCQTVVCSDSYTTILIPEHPPRVMRRRIGWYVCHPCPGCSRFRMAAFSLIESLGGYGGQNTLSPSTHVFGTISVAPLLNCIMHHLVIFLTQGISKTL